MNSLDGNGMVRNHFEPETTFGEREDFVSAIIRGYDAAAERALRSARAAVALGGSDNMGRARWDEAVVETLERVLGLLPRSNDCGDFPGDKTLELPTKPDFET